MDFPRVLYKPAGDHCKVEDSEEYDRAKADGWSDAVPTDWNNTPDPDVPGASLPLPPISPVPPAKDEPPAPVFAAAKRGRGAKNGDDE